MNLQTFCEPIYPPLPGIARRVAAFDVTALTTNQTRFSWNEQHRPTCSNRTIETMYSVHIGFFILRQHSKSFSTTQCFIDAGPDRIRFHVFNSFHFKFLMTKRNPWNYSGHSLMKKARLNFVGWRLWWPSFGSEKGASEREGHWRLANLCFCKKFPLSFH